MFSEFRASMLGVVLLTALCVPAAIMGLHLGGLGAGKLCSTEATPTSVCRKALATRQQWSGQDLYWVDYTKALSILQF